MSHFNSKKLFELFLNYNVYYFTIYALPVSANYAESWSERIIEKFILLYLSTCTLLCFHKVN